MNYLAYHESRVRGTFDFPIEWHHITPVHPRYSMPFHWHMEYELILVRSGRLDLSLDGEPMPLSPGDVVLVPDGVIHGGEPAECVYECIVFDFHHFLQTGPRNRAALGRELGHSMRIQPFFSAGSEAAALLKQLFDTVAEEKEGYEWAATGLLLEWVGLILRQRLYDSLEEGEKSRKTAGQIKRALRRIRADYAGELTLEDLAAEAGLTPRYFCRVFRQVTGRSPIDYLNYYRIECAAERLGTTGDSVTDIALACGFNDLSYFVKQFRRYKGVSTREYRRSSGKQDSTENTEEKEGAEDTPCGEAYLPGN